MTDEQLLIPDEYTAKNISKSERRSISTVSAGLRRSLQTCQVKENEEKLDGLLEFYKKRKSNLKAQVIEALFFVLRHLLAASSKEDTRGRGFLSFDEAFGLYNLLSNFRTVPLFGRNIFIAKLFYEE